MELRPASPGDWKRCCEGIARGLCPQLEWVNRQEEDALVREYLQDGTVVARMTVFGGDELPSQDCTRAFEIASSILDRVKHIYIPTQDEWDEWDEMRADESDEDEAWLRRKGIIE